MEFTLRYQHMLNRWSGSTSVKELRCSDRIWARGSTWPSLLSLQTVEKWSHQNATNISTATPPHPLSLEALPQHN